MKTYRNVEFNRTAEYTLYMDIYVPEDTVNPPIVMWIHGGGWNELNRTWSLMGFVSERGYAVANVEYRYANEAPFPAQMLDLKEALLFLKKHGAEYGYDASRIAVSGDSAGAHLACLIGVSEGQSLWEKPDEDYSVQAVVDFCGPTDLSLCGPKNEGTDLTSPLVDLLGVSYASKAIYERAAAASPLTYINGTEPPFLIIHGSTDPIVDPVHARHLRNALEAAGDLVHMYYIPGGVHSMGGPLLENIVCEFLDYYLKGIKVVTEPKVKPHHMRAYDVNSDI